VADDTLAPLAATSPWSSSCRDVFDMLRQNIDVFFQFVPKTPTARTFCLMMMHHVCEVVKTYLEKIRESTLVRANEPPKRQVLTHLPQSLCATVAACFFSGCACCYALCMLSITCRRLGVAGQVQSRAGHADAGAALDHGPQQPGCGQDSFLRARLGSLQGLVGRLAAARRGAVAGWLNRVVGNSKSAALAGCAMQLTGDFHTIRARKYVQRTE
jgi:hypothetical protein